MLLAFDVGNTNIVMGLYKGKDLKGSWRMETNQKKSADEYAVFIRQLFDTHGFTFKDVDDVIISTVVPSMTYTLQHMCRYYFKCEPMIVGPGIKTGLIIKYDNPKMLGADRIVNSVAAVAKYPAPLIIIDCGTATTFCAVSDSLSVTPHSLRRLPNIKQPRSGATLGSRIQVMMVTAMGKMIFSALETVRN